MPEILWTGRKLGEGTKRKFYEVQIVNGDEIFRMAGCGFPIAWIAEHYSTTAEAELTRILDGQGVLRDQHRLVLPIAREVREDKVPVVYYPLIGQGKNLLRELIVSKDTGSSARVSKEAFFSIIGDVAQGLDTMHTLGFSIWDFKTDSILLDGERAFIADFELLNHNLESEQINRNTFFHIMEVMLVGGWIDKYFNDNNPKVLKELFINGVRTLNDDYRKDRLVDPDGILNGAVGELYSEEVAGLIQKYRNMREGSLKNAVKDLEKIMKNF